MRGEISCSTVTSSGAALPGAVALIVMSDSRSALMRNCGPRKSPPPVRTPVAPCKHTSPLNMFPPPVSMKLLNVDNVTMDGGWQVQAGHLNGFGQCCVFVRQQGGCRHGGRIHRHLYLVLNAPPIGTVYCDPGQAQKRDRPHDRHCIACPVFVLNKAYFCYPIHRFDPSSSVSSSACAIADAASHITTLPVSPAVSAKNAWAKIATAENGTDSSAWI